MTRKLQSFQGTAKFPRNWQKMTKSSYKDEKHFAILTGKINDIIVIDLDFKEKEFVGLQWFEDIFGAIDTQDTLVTKTNGKTIRYFASTFGNHFVIGMKVMVIK
jgi:hypothetical protein